jgi:hypothetical protein
VPDTTSPPPPIEPGVATFPTPTEKIGTSRGCFKWGLIGCAGLSVVVIVGLVLLGTKAKGFLDSKLREKGQEIVAKATPDVTDADKTAFQNAYAAFIERAKGGRVPIGRMTSFTSKSDQALADEKITPEEIHDLTAEVSGQ